MSTIKSIITSDFFVLVVIPITIVVGVLYLCKIYKFSIIPKSLRKKKKGKFKIPNIDRKQIDKSLGYGGKYMWTVDETNTANEKDEKISYKNTEEKPFFMSASRVVPKPIPRRNIYD